MPTSPKTRRAVRKKVPRRVGGKPGATTPTKVSILDADDVRQILLELADRIAPADVTDLLAHEDQLRERASQLTSPHLGLFRDQIGLSIDCLRDHARGRCPQIPYFTISLLAAALWYFVDELDAVPDFLPSVGQLDDAVVLAMGFQLGEQGLRRYCAWKGRPADALFGAAAALRLRATSEPRKRRR
jgi:uncharacterized membrane protein YkvA (DUF1232 family)